MTPDRLKLADDLVQAALTREPDERAKFLDEACAGDDELRHEVESLLAYDERAECFLEEPALQHAAAWFVADQHESLVAQRIGHYEILSRIGKGAMGEVYLAQDLTLGRKVALKLLPSHSMRDPDRVRRFSQEARAASALNHPNIITIHEIGEFGEVNFIGTEFINGQTLRQLIAQGQLKTADVLEIGIQVSSALMVAHEAGIVHRDIKPENLMVRPDGLVKVLDFGLAKLLEPAASPNDDPASMTKAVSTQSGAVLGTTRYMSPEQARGQKVDERTDIFSLGAVLYEMLTGRPAFEGNGASADIAAILEREPPPLGKYANEVPEPLQEIVTKALAKNRDERYQTAKNLLDDLKTVKEEVMFAARLTTRQFSQTTGKESSPQPARYIRHLLAKHKLVFVSTTLILLATIVGAYRYHKRPAANASPPQIESIAVLPFLNQSGRGDVDYLSDGMTESLITSLSKLPNLSVKAQSSVVRFKGKVAPPQQVGKELNVQAIVTGTLVQRGNDLLLHIELVDANTETAVWSEDYNRSMANLLALQGEIVRDVARKLRTKLSGGDDQKLARNYPSNTEAYQLYLRARSFWNTRTEEGLKKGLEDFQRATELDPNYALAYTGIADSYVVLEFFGWISPKEAFPRARAAATKALEIDDALGEAHVSLGRVKLAYDWDSSGAETEFKRALELNPNYPTAHTWYAYYLAAVGRHDEAISECKRAVELDPLSEITIVGLGYTGYFMARQYDQALEQYRKTLEINPSFAKARAGLMNTYLQKGMYEEAFAERLKFRLPAAESADLKQAYKSDGWRAIRRRDLKMDLAYSRLHYLPPSDLAMDYASVGDKDRAFEWLEKVFQERNSVLVYLKVDPRWDSLRSDPRFADLLRRIGLWS
jgi:serine/threonine-protein kinase